MRPSSIASLVSPATVRTSSLAISDSRWVSTVRWEMPSRAAISLLVSPPATPINTSFSRGLQVAAELHRQGSRTKVLMLSMYDQPEYVLESVKSGARGYLLKDSPPAELRRAVRAVFNGEQFFPPAVAARLTDALRAPAPQPAATDVLTPREKEVLIGVAGGESFSR